MCNFAGPYEFIDYQETGWPFELMSADEIALTNCPNVTIPAAFQARDMIVINDGGIKVEIVFDNAILVMVTGARFCHIIADQYVGKRLSDAVEISQLRQHPVSSMIIHTLNVLDDGLDIELR